MHKQTVLVTGATSGIGKKIAETLSKNVNLILVGRSKTKLRNLSQKLTSSNNTIEVFVMDLSDFLSIRTVATRICKRAPKIDWLINNAGAIESANPDTLKQPEKQFEKIMRVNAIGPYLLTHLIQTSLLRGRGGVFNISSTAGLRGNPGFPFYAASKAALINLTESKARNDQFTARGLKAINIIPGATNTPMRQRVAGDAAQKQSPEIIANWIADAILKNNAPESGISVTFIDGKIKRLKSR